MMDMLPQKTRTDPRAVAPRLPIPDHGSLSICVQKKPPAYHSLHEEVEANEQATPELPANPNIQLRVNKEAILPAPPTFDLDAGTRQQEQHPFLQCRLISSSRSCASPLRTSRKSKDRSGCIKIETMLAFLGQ